MRIVWDQTDENTIPVAAVHLIRFFLHEAFHFIVGHNNSDAFGSM